MPTYSEAVGLSIQICQTLAERLRETKTALIVKITWVLAIMDHPTKTEMVLKSGLSTVVKIYKRTPRIIYGLIIYRL